VLSIAELAEEMWGDQGDAFRKATVLLLRLTAAARQKPTDWPLIPHRLHVLFRSPHGLSACLDPDCSGPISLRINGIGCLQEISDRCRYCSAITLPVYRCKACGLWALAGYEHPESAQIEPGHFAKASEVKYYLVTFPFGKKLQGVVVEPLKGRYSATAEGRPIVGTQLFRAPCPEHHEMCFDTQCHRQHCPHCETEWTSQNDPGSDEPNERIQPLRGGEHLVLGVAAETILHGMPEFVDTDNSRDWKPAKGRRLLCFSDSRRDAARLGPLLTEQHETWVARAAIASALGEPLSSKARMERQLRTFESESGLVPKIETNS